MMWDIVGKTLRVPIYDSDDKYIRCQDNFWPLTEIRMKHYCHKKNRKPQPDWPISNSFIYTQINPEDVGVLI